MKKVFLLISIFVILISSAKVIAQQYVDSLTLELTRHFEKSDLPGFSVAIVNEEGTLYQKGFGLATKSNKKAFEFTTIENLGSVSKTIVGVALIKAIQDGKLTMDTKINDILPFPIRNPYFKETPILIRHLANHTSSILDTKHYGKTYIIDQHLEKEENVHLDFLGFLKSHQTIELKAFLFNLFNKSGKWFKKKNFLKAKPGTKKEYANLNAALTAYIIEIVTDMSFEEYTQTKIFSPLNMANTSWDIDKVDENELATGYFPLGKIVPRYQLVTYPDGGLYSNTVDLSVFLKEMIKVYAGTSEYLSIEYGKLLLPNDGDNDRAFWGIGKKSRNIGHGGSDPGVQTDLQFNADSKIGRIILANVNAEDNEKQWAQYQEIHHIIKRYEDKLKEE